jgi:hypothetical protein
MVRTALFAGLAAAGLSLTAATADAHPPVVYPQINTGYYRPGSVVVTPALVCHDYCVLYRTCSHEPWQCYGTYETSYRAERAAHHLRHRGFEVFVRAR